MHDCFGQMDFPTLDTKQELELNQNARRAVIDLAVITTIARVNKKVVISRRHV